MIAPSINFEKYIKVTGESLFKTSGRVVNVVGLTIESAGPAAKLGDICKIYPVMKEDATASLAEVVGFKEGKTLLMPYQNVEGIGPGSTVENTGAPLKVRVDGGLLGHTLDGLGRIEGQVPLTGEEYAVEAKPPDPMSRKIIDEVLPLGVKAVDGLITVGKGQRIGIFAGSGVGKSTLMGMFARNTKADINVIALIGERGREVREFIERDLGPEGMRRSVVVVATSDKPALERKKAAQSATAIAEYFRDQGKDVLLMMDSLTRFSMAQREIGLASGEPPVSRGYPPSVYSEMPKLLERAGRSDKGSITGLYTVLVDGDDFNEPITDTARSILDGHIMLNRRLAHKDHYPAIDVLQSISRCMSQIAQRDHKSYAGKLKNVLATYNEAEDLINIGAYKSGSNPGIDYAIRKIEEVNAYLRQDVGDKFSFEESVELLKKFLTRMRSKYIYRKGIAAQAAIHKRNRWLNLYIGCRCNSELIKRKIQEQARMEFASARIRLDEEEEKLRLLLERKEGYQEQGRILRKDGLKVLKIMENRDAVGIMDEFIADQRYQVSLAERALEDARLRLQLAMQESKTQQRLREKAFEEFLHEENVKEAKEIDELVSYTHGHR